MILRVARFLYPDWSIKRHFILWGFRTHSNHVYVMFEKWRLVRKENGSWLISEAIQIMKRKVSTCKFVCIILLTIQIAVLDLHYDFN